MDERIPVFLSVEEYHRIRDFDSDLRKEMARYVSVRLG